MMRKRAQEISSQFTGVVMGGKYKPVAKKVLPVARYDPDAVVPVYQPIEIGELNPLLVNPVEFKLLKYNRRLSNDQIAKIVSQILAPFLSKPELDLLVHLLYYREKNSLP